MQLSIVMMVKNESRYLDRCLTSLASLRKEVSSELIIVDTGSEDNTVEIAKRHTDKVYFHPWNNDFAAMRNITISYAKGEWVFILDGDEILEDPNDIISFFQSNKHKGYNSCTIGIKNFSIEDVKYTLAYIPRLFKKTKDFRYEGNIHEQATLKNPNYLLKSKLLHYGYITTDKELVEKKFKRNYQLLIDGLEKNPENVYYWFQLAQTYGSHYDYEEAIEANLKAYHFAKQQGIDLRNRMHIYINLALLYFIVKRYPELERLCYEAIQVKDGYIDEYYFLAKAQQELFKDEQAIENYEAYLDMAQHYDDFPGSKDFQVATYTLDMIDQVYVDLCKLYNRQGKHDKVLEYGIKLIDSNLIKEGLFFIIQSHLKLSEINKLKEFYQCILSRKNKDLTHYFTQCIEDNKAILGKDRIKEITNIFSHIQDTYGTLNLVRLALNENIEMSAGDLIESMKKINLNETPMFYADNIFLAMKLGCSLSDCLNNVMYYRIEKYFQYLINQYENQFIEQAVIYLNNNDFKCGIVESKINKALIKILLLSNLLDKKTEKCIFTRYIEEGLYFITHIYHQDVIENKWISEVDEEEGFLIYVYHSKRTSTKNKLEHIEYLKRALQIYPFMKNGIEFMLDDVNSERNSTNEEFEEYKSSIKRHIEECICERNIQKAERLIDELEKIVSNDLEVLMLKSRLIVADI
ncbi:glycosyltransferase involved in cell wall biosynthesis [Anaerosolibacter carboniphilus]|uniref:Glycosyltransferase involved in cell wall biosynthesis n=1 Tax=Anaerosolibacter carboniphilus TaxID=1417629 RepID=A0A841L204_9FIRM|nr:glycosyltransferase family 2 protein [Anaerosolibacter carboniphilus]MBB6216419.1 glycosyltransferase involved in cell wall biosynthesis [Anaerosolibacter carboniphilus]